MADNLLQEVLDFIVKYSGIDVAHHKDWVLDQVVRMLTDCPMEERMGLDAYGDPYIYMALGESEEYKNLVANAKSGVDGPNTYDWEVGIPP